MKLYSRKFQQLLPITLEEAWDFFSSPQNLNKITPTDMKFVITSKHAKDQKIYAGMLISYIVSPFKGIKMDWLTEITHVNDHVYFIDEQRFGPYAFWHHQHHFENTKDGVLMTDELTYAIPFGIVGRIANKLIVSKKIDLIFDYRFNKIKELFVKKLSTKEYICFLELHLFALTICQYNFESQTFLASN